MEKNEEQILVEIYTILKYIIEHELTDEQYDKLIDGLIDQKNSNNEEYLKPNINE